MQNTGFCNDSIRKRWRLSFFHFLFFFLFFYFLFFYEILCYHFFVILSHHCNFCPTIPLPEDSGGDCLYFFFHRSSFLLRVFYVILWYHLALCNVCVLVRMAGPKPFLKNWFAAVKLLFSFFFFRKEEEVGIT